MARKDLRKEAPPSGAVLYLDTSIVTALSLLPAKDKAEQVPAVQLDTARDVEEFLKRSTSSKLVTTILTLEELAAKMRNVDRGISAESAGFKNWKEFKYQKPTEAAAADKRAHSFMLRMMEYALMGLDGVKAVMTRPTVSGDAAESARKLRKAHRELLRKYPSLDAMDALHITLGGELGATNFASLDAGWEQVDTITVYR